MNERNTFTLFDENNKKTCDGTLRVPVVMPVNDIYKMSLRFNQEKFSCLAHK